MKALLDLILQLLGGSRPAPQQPPKEEIKTQPEPIKDVIEPIKATQEPGPVMTIDDWITSSGKYPERAKSEELTYDVRSAAMLLVDKINDLGRRLKLGKLPISSGFRPTKVNASIKGAAKASGHTRGFAVDFVDVDGKLKELFKQNHEILRELGLFLEHPDFTKTWAHLDYISRPDRPDRIFKP